MLQLAYKILIYNTNHYYNNFASGNTLLTSIMTFFAPFSSFLGANICGLLCNKKYHTVLVVNLLFNKIIQLAFYQLY